MKIMIPKDLNKNVSKIRIFQKVITWVCLIAGFISLKREYFVILGYLSITAGTILLLFYYVIPLLVWIHTMALTIKFSFREKRGKTCLCRKKFTLQRMKMSIRREHKMISKEKASELVFFLKSLSLTALGGFCCTIIYEMFHYLAGESTPVLFANAFSYCGQILIRIWGTPYVIFAYAIGAIIFFSAILATLLGGEGLLAIITYWTLDIILPKKQENIERKNHD